MLPAVHAVDLADHARDVPLFADRDGRQLSVWPEGELKGHRLKVRMLQLVGDLVHDALRRAAQPVEKVAETRALFRKIRQHAGAIVRNGCLHQGVQLAFFKRVQAAARLGRAQCVLHHIMHEGTDLRRVKARARALLRPQAVAQEVGEMARARLVHLGGGQAQRIAVQRAHRAL